MECVWESAAAAVGCAAMESDVPSLRSELNNVVTHGIGFLASMAALVWLVFYAGIYGEMIAREVAYNMSTSETYKKTSNQYWVEKMALNYHATTVYDYFVKTFPDLFD